MEHAFFIGPRLHLRAIEPEDLEILYTMENDPKTWDVTNFNVPYSRYLLRQYIQDTQCDIFADRQLRLMITLREDNVVVGTIDITDFVPSHVRGEVGIAIRSDYQGNGYAAEALELLCDYVFGFLSLHQLTAHVATDNIPSLRLFKSCGFVECGVLREWWCVCGHFKDVVLLQRIQDK